MCRTWGCRNLCHGMGSLLALKTKLFSPCQVVIQLSALLKTAIPMFFHNFRSVQVHDLPWVFCHRYWDVDLPRFTFDLFDHCHEIPRGSVQVLGKTEVVISTTDKLQDCCLFGSCSCVYWILWAQASHSDGHCCLRPLVISELASGNTAE